MDKTKYTKKEKEVDVSYLYACVSDELTYLLTKT